ncbi:MAG: hypothetical protein K1X57_05845 [Gemmataceae bacterium]|nr:hypothetical protein [Gemmataceae bacterium]
MNKTFHLTVPTFQLFETSRFLRSARQVNVTISRKDEMHELTEAEMIWNRACGEDPLRVLPGDRALTDLLRAHGLAMNGGLLHAVECMTAEELSDAYGGYRYFGIGDVASLLARARGIFETADDLESHELQLDIEYAQLIPSDSSLVERFEQQLKTRPSDFAPLRPMDVGSG